MIYTYIYIYYNIYTYIFPVLLASTRDCAHVAPVFTLRHRTVSGRCPATGHRARLAWEFWSYPPVNHGKTIGKP